MAGERPPNWPKLSEEEKASLRTRWTEAKVQEVIAALRAKEPLPVEEIPVEVIVQDYDAGALIKRHPAEVSLKFFDLRSIPLADCNLKGVDLGLTYLEGADLRNCNLSGVNLQEANLRDANLMGARLDYANLDNASLTGANLSEAKVYQGSLKNAILYSSNLKKAVLWAANLERAEFADLRASWLFGLTGVGVFGESIANANLGQANLASANLKGAVLGQANLEGANLFGAVFGDTPVDVLQLEKAKNYRYIRPGKESPIVDHLPAGVVENYHREAKNFFKRNQMGEMALEYHFWENEAKTRGSPLYIRLPRLVFLKWPYGYGSRPIWLVGYSLLVVALFALLFVLVTLPRKTKSGICSVMREKEQEQEVLLSWRKGLLIGDCIYFSLLSLATFGYGTFRPRQWLEFFRLEQVEYRPTGWARILVGIEAALGIYLFALLATVLLGAD